MTRKNVAHSELNGKSVVLENFDHYIAIDWSMKVMAIAHMTPCSKTPKVFERATDLKELQEYLCSLKGRIVLTIEETTTAQWLFLELFEYVDRIVICDPFWNKLLCHGPKTDTIDAGKLCMLLYNGLLHEVFHSASTVYELRLLVGSYQDLIRVGVSALNQKSALVRGHRDQSSTASFIIEHLDTTIEHYRASKAEYEKQFNTIVRKNKLVAHLTRVDGIGDIGAVKIVACVIDARRFPNRGKYLSYCGLVKHEKLSGQRSYGRRQPRFNHMLKGVYKTAAHALIGKNNPINEYYESLRAKGVAEHNARHAVSRYIARITYGMLKSGQPYDPYRWRHSAIEQENS